MIIGARCWLRVTGSSDTAKRLPQNQISEKIIQDRDDAEDEKEEKEEEEYLLILQESQPEPCGTQHGEGFHVLMEEELEERIFQKWVENNFYDDEELMKLNNHKRKNTIWKQKRNKKSAPKNPGLPVK